MKLRRKREVRAAVLTVAAALVLAFGVGGAAVGWSTFVLRGGKLRSWVNGDPEKLLLEYGAASTSWPGRIRVRRLRLRGRDPNVEWEFRIDDCRVRVSLFDLLRKRFHATSVEATGLSFRLRRRIERGRATPERVRYLPPIEGFAPVPLKGRPPALPDRRAEDLWEVAIDRLRASSVKEIWVDGYRYEGSAILEGRMRLRPRIRASVGPARLEWGGGALSLFGRKAAEPIRARVECRIAPFDPERVPGPAVWDFLSAKADWSGDLAGLEFFNTLLGAGPALTGGRGTMTGALRIDDGRGEARVAISAANASARYAKDELRGSVAGELRMDPWSPAAGVAEVVGSYVSLDHVSAAGGRVQEWRGRFDIASGRLRSAPGGLELAARVESRCRDARPLYTLFGVGLPRWTRGLLSLQNFAGRAGVELAPRLLRVRGLDARGGTFRVRGDFLRKGQRTEGAFLVEDPPLRVGVDLGTGSSRLVLFESRKWFAERSGGD